MQDLNFIQWQNLDLSRYITLRKITQRQNPAVVQWDLAPSIHAQDCSLKFAICFSLTLANPDYTLGFPAASFLRFEPAKSHKSHQSQFSGVVSFFQPALLPPIHFDQLEDLLSCMKINQGVALCHTANPTVLCTTPLGSGMFLASSA